MTRRDFITLLGGAAVAWPLAARAQQPGQMRRVSALMGWSEENPEYRTWFAAFVQGLAELGWVDGRKCGSTCIGRVLTSIGHGHSRKS